MRTIIIAIVLLFISNAHANDFEDGLMVKCDKYQMQFYNFDYTDGEPEQKQHVGTTIYKDRVPRTLSCVINNHNIEINFQMINPGSYKCATETIFTLKIDNELIIKDARIDSCPTGSYIVNVSPNLGANGDLKVMFCSYTDPGKVPNFRGCVSVTETQLQSIKKPLNPRFPVGDIIHFVKFPR